MDDNSITNMQKQERFQASGTVSGKKRVPLHKSIRAFTRLMIGGATNGYYALINQLQGWDEEMSSRSEAEQKKDFTSQFDDYSQYYRSEPEVNNRTYISLPPDDETPGEQTRFALIGLALDTQDRINAGLHTANRAANLLGRLASPLLTPFQKSRLFAPARRQFDSLVERGEDQVNQWVNTGRTEDARSRELAETALYETIDSGVGYFADNPEVRDLVQAQSIGMATEIVEEVRERTVSGDTFLDALFRAVFRRTPRAELPRAPDIVREQALSKQSSVTQVQQPSGKDGADL